MRQTTDKADQEQAAVSNEQLYQELRRLHRRVVAGTGLLATAMTGGFLLVEPVAAAVPGFAAVLCAVLAAYLDSGRFRRFVGWFHKDSPMPEPDLRERLGEPFESEGAS